MTDRLADNAKKYPLLLIGELSFLTLDARHLAKEDLEQMAEGSLDDFYVLIALPLSETEESLEILKNLKLSPEQILIYGDTGRLQARLHDFFMCFLEKIEGENGEELRARLLARLESQRQKKLALALQSAELSGLPGKISEDEMIRTVDCLRLAHALSCGYNLSPAAHRNVLRECMEPAATLPWVGEPRPEQLLPEAARLIVETAGKGGSIRDALRDRSSSLSFRSRNELLHQVESCLSGILGGKNAA